MNQPCQRMLGSLGLVLWGLAPTVHSETLTVGRVTLAAQTGHVGVVERVDFGGRTVCPATTAAPATIAVLAPPVGQDEASLFGNTVAQVLTGRVERVEFRDGALHLAGRYAGAGGLAVPFERSLAAGPGNDTVRFTETANYAALPPGWRVAQHAVRLPLAVTNDPHWRLFGFGCTNRAELFRMDMNDLTGRMQLISAPRAHWPYWDLGGVLQLPGSYRVWKANHADTPAYVLQEGPGAPGWADYSERDWGVTAQVVEPDGSAPWGIAVDARAGVMTFELWPAAHLPVEGTRRGARTFAVDLRFHDTSWPAPVTCELDFVTYRALLDDIGDYIDSAVGTSDRDAIIHRERLQPSTVLRLLYRGDAWRMAGRVAKVGIQTPRNQSMEKWEVDARRYLDFIRTNGLPAAAKKQP